ncbi:ABC transporter substrate-binding protein [Aquabacter spiritensis]|uniref:NitT/TauT family transport system substrate-binding protein n=1 Tax=Aquabacter spiritensis TaxID=933073 RepID=A0A4R3LVN9_9HYPH|nr:ABC transporter substrate-binding protein [Aquabacter spiritensis]TCT04623.1 NitT/TauT family transport system substrate-binding protein [Aquabacter spiritensis]
MKRFAALSLLAGAVALASLPAAAQGKLKTVTLLQPVPQIDIRNAPWAVAEEKGWLAEEGLKVEIQTVKGATVVIQQILNGSAQYGMPPPENAVVAYQKGAPLKFFFAFTSRSPFPMAVIADGPIKSIADLKDKTIGLHSLTAVQFYTTQAIMNSAGLKLDRDFKMVDVGAGPAALKALQNGQIAALSTNVLNYAGFENRGAKFRYLISPQVEPIFGWSLMTSAAYLEANRAEAVGIARAFNRAQLFCRENGEACVKAYYKRFPETLPPGVSEEQAVKDQMRILQVFLDYAPKAEGKPWGYYDPKAWTDVVDYMVATGQMEKPVDPTGLYTNDLLTSINETPKSRTQ